MRGLFGLKLIRGSRTPRNAQRALARALERQRKRSAEVGTAVSVQLVGQVTPAQDWPELRAYWSERHPKDVAEWVRHLDPGAYALNLWPMPPGRVGRAAGMAGDVRKRQPKQLLSSPAMTVFNPQKTGTDAKTALAVICSIWLEETAMGAFQAILLAPPILETWGKNGRLIARDVIDFGLEWTLPPADGLITGSPHTDH